MRDQAGSGLPSACDGALHIGRDTPDGINAWLLESEGFLVDGSDGREIGVVDRVATAGDPPVASALVVSAGWFGRRRLRVDAAAVDALLPAERRLIVDVSRMTSVRADTGA